MMHISTKEAISAFIDQNWKQISDDIINFNDIETAVAVNLLRQKNHATSLSRASGYYRRLGREIFYTIFKEKSKNGTMWARNHRLLDHGGFDKDHPQQWIAEPYSLTMRDLKDLIEQCEIYGTTFTITGRSYHYPGKTLRLTIMDGDKQ